MAATGKVRARLASAVDRALGGTIRRDQRSADRNRGVRRTKWRLRGNPTWSQSIFELSPLERRVLLSATLRYVDPQNVSDPSTQIEMTVSGDSSSYEIYRAINGTFQPVGSASNGGTFTDSGLEPNTLYVYEAEGSADDSNQLNAKTGGIVQVYANNFVSPPVDIYHGASLSGGGIVTGAHGTTFYGTASVGSDGLLGLQGSSSVTLTLTNLPAHGSGIVDVGALMMEAWQGNAWTIKVGNQQIFSSTFTNPFFDGFNWHQAPAAYTPTSDIEPGPDGNELFLAAGDTCGFAIGDGSYAFDLPFNDGGKHSLTITFQAPGLPQTNIPELRACDFFRATF